MRQGKSGVPDGDAGLARSHGRIGVLTTILGPGALNSIRPDGWEEFEFIVDSGASETVVGPDMLSSAETRAGYGSKTGVRYEVANGGRIDNLGEKKFMATSEEGISRTVTAQVCEVNKGLMSVHKLVSKGNRVVFAKEHSYIEDAKPGERMLLEERNGTWLLKVWTESSGNEVFEGREQTFY